MYIFKFWSWCSAFYFRCRWLAFTSAFVDFNLTKVIKESSAVSTGCLLFGHSFAALSQCHLAPTFGRFSNLLGEWVVECCFAISQHSNTLREDAVVIRFSANNRKLESKSPSSFRHLVEGQLLGELVIRVGQHALDGVDASVLNELLLCADAVLLAGLPDSDDYKL